MCETAAGAGLTGTVREVRDMPLGGGRGQRDGLCCWGRRRPPPPRTELGPPGWAGRHQEGASRARPQPRNGARPCLRRRPEREHTASVWGLTLRVTLLSPNSCGPFSRTARPAPHSSSCRNMSSLERIDRLPSGKREQIVSARPAALPTGDLSSVTHCPAPATPSHLPTPQRDFFPLCAHS